MMKLVHLGMNLYKIQRFYEKELQRGQRGKLKEEVKVNAMDNKDPLQRVRPNLIINMMSRANRKVKVKSPTCLKIDFGRKNTRAEALTTIDALCQIENEWFKIGVCQSTLNRDWSTTSE